MFARCALLTLLLSAYAVSAHAIVCVPPKGYTSMSVAEQHVLSHNISTVVFAGRVVSTSGEYDTQIQTTNFEVLRVWKGARSKTQLLREGTAFGSAKHFLVGSVYLIFARSDERGLYLHSCLPLTQLQEVNGKVRYPQILGRGRKPDA
jgi:hypothetical protein